ncbi:MULTISPECIES: hypothetical protein [unclassified Francisella]|uniref:hypothetical protein n=1 Tax=unclassified Francisella TaxID=2610885 RepID=UPI002E36129E|nr:MULTISPECIES: hypothetical protein [unclassified Francisella]MED7820395.1 hypothetical protein [Francisella sp. 19S2-4]MED7831229.1 hypothetical protein [Francisella sp. 19S2-10]
MSTSEKNDFIKQFHARIDNGESVFQAVKIIKQQTRDFFILKYINAYQAAKASLNCL